MEIAGELCCDSGHAVAQAVDKSLAFHLRRQPSVAGSPRGVYSAELRNLFSITATLLILYWLSSLSTSVYACQSQFRESFRLVYNNRVWLSRAHDAGEELIHFRRNLTLYTDLEE